ncbi:MAG: alpha/beta fold hydrolase [Anaerolineaceae bacterium]|nr:alpha/beta fold hydrolase [Anaerolineaceae bacterium]
MGKLIRCIATIFCALFIPSMSVTGGVFAQTTTQDRLDKLGGYPCPDSDFTCVKLTVPLDHFAKDDSRTIDVVFGVLPATGERKGTFVIATGGPGSSGLAAADSYVPYYDTSIPEHYDIVFFDQRGSYLSGNLQCPNAVAIYYSSDGEASTPEQEKALIQTAHTFADDCIKEMGVDRSTLPFYGTNQAVADLETFRQAIGDEKIWLYGESYGTQYAQTYTAAYPEHVAGLILDGTVDMTHSLTDYYVEQTQAFSDVIQETLQACNADESCAGDFVGGDAIAFYDTIRTELGSKAETLNFPLPNGTQATRQFTLSDLQTVVANLGYSEGDRMLLLRALAAASHGDLVPLKREFYVALGIDPATEEPIPGSSDDYSDALYYAVECNDYALAGDTPAERAENYVRAGDQTDVNVPDLASIFYGDLPCAFWPGNPPAERPAPLVAKGIPTLVLGATADPATPVDNGRHVFKNLDDGYLITMQGGPHVIYARGDACPDDLVTAFLVEDKMPAERETTCDGTVIDAYLPNAPADAGHFETALEAMDSTYTEIYYLPEYYYGSTSDTIEASCPYSGSITFDVPDDNGQAIHLKDCAFSEGFSLTGDGNYADGAITLDVRVSGLKEGQLNYSVDADGNSKVTGDYGGEKVDLSSSTSA